MKTISLQNHVKLTQRKSEKVNELVAKCISTACEKTSNIREVLKGDMRSLVESTRFQKAS